MIVYNILIHIKIKIVACNLVRLKELNVSVAY